MLKEPPAPDDVTSAMLRGLADTIYPQQFYVLDLKDVAAKDLAAARQTGWRFMGTVGGRDMELQVEHARRGKPPVMTEMSHGPHVTAARDAIRKIVKSPEVKRHNYELRLLAIPALSVEAVWLAGGRKVPDLVVPYVASPGLKSMRFYSAERFLAALGPQAAQQAKFDSGPRVRR
jgi:hypothetical protein